MVGDLPRPWGRRLRWFVAEFFVVTMGLLAALALDAWWQGRKDSARADAYLGQIHADLAATERSFTAADSLLDVTRPLVLNLSRALYAAERPAAPDLFRWLEFSGRVTYPRPILGTLEAIVGNGQVELLANDTLEVQLTSYLDEVKGLFREYERAQALWFEGYLARRASYDRLEGYRFRYQTQARLDSAARADSLAFWPVGGSRRPFPLDPDRLLSDPAFYAAQRKTEIANAGMDKLGGLILDLTRNLSTRIEREQARRAD